MLRSSNEDLNHDSVPVLLKINTLVSSTTALPVYTHKVVGEFRITTDLKYSLRKTDIPKLLPDSTLKSLVGYNLLVNFDSKTSCKKLIKDYNTYNETKHKYFSQWLRKEKPKIPDLDDIKFVAFQGRLLRALKTPLNKTYGEWQTYAMNVDNVIYLWDEITVGTKSGLCNNPFNMEGNYMGELFEQLVTGREPKPGGIIDGLNKVELFNSYANLNIINIPIKLFAIILQLYRCFLYKRRASAITNFCCSATLMLSMKTENLYKFKSKHKQVHIKKSILRLCLRGT